jgi:hypothetical protein
MHAARTVRVTREDLSVGNEKALEDAAVAKVIYTTPALSFKLLVVCKRLDMYFLSKRRNAMGCGWSRAIVVEQGLRLTKIMLDHKYTIINATTA